MRVINCLIVDDEPIARDIITNYCSHLPFLHIAGACGNTLEAKHILQEKLIDLIFLDIHMPVLDGVSFLKTLKNPPQIIFTTAYKEYAVNAFDLAACDYLVKPFSLERFIVATDKALEKLNAITNQSLSNNKVEDDFILIKTDGKIYKIKHDDLLYAEAKGNYTKIVTTDKVLNPGISFTGFEKMLPATFFVRVHRSFIINKSKIDHIKGNCVYINKVEVPIGNNYKEVFLKGLGL